MNKREKVKKLILIIILLIISLGLIYVYKNPQKTEDNIPSTTKEKATVTENTFLEINNQRYGSNINSKITIYEFMQKLRSEGKINFKEKNYIGMGEFIDEINGIKSNGEKNWIYYVNNKKANIGISNYKINPGDIISWKYEKEY